ncbi:response regulator transcription factor [Klebsiella pneumoniae]|uniref:response regulator transcription factor n=1 Tax=Enterobacteriaceae TaxID=543 RepID=UPI0020CD4BFC|nr:MULTISPECIES: response regulator transcription factor [Enterobacteriaceae]MCQ0556584.1 response regulator transcription factor [Klebsiella pneumoniae]MDA4308531.1 response regulator transcription factor [Escherichia coli]MDA4425802.1 response regulator transcription factor [Escherichia coli]MDA4435195.1 response regulator transcription factor [Escherichia coli]
MRMLLAEDNARLASLIAAGLTDEGFAVRTAGTLASARSALASDSYDLMLLDLGMPDGDGVVFLREIRRAGQSLPVLVITARDGLNNRVLGLDSGADDYVVKPVDLPELAARSRALLRRPGACLGTTLSIANLEFDSTGREARVNSVRIPIPPRELDLLERLMRRAGHVVTKRALENALYGLDTEVTPNALEATVSRLRRRLASARADVTLHTAHGIGYMMTASRHDGQPAR